MPVFNIPSKPKVISLPDTPNGTNITNVFISNTPIINEDLSRQIASNQLTYSTSFKFVKSSLDVFVNGMKLTPIFDYVELDSSTGFSFVVLDYNMSKLFNSNSTILVKYIKY